MKQNKVKVELLPHTPFLKYNGKFDRNTAIEYCGKIAGECYEPDGWETLKNEDENKTKRRVELTLGLEHSTPYEHVNIGFEITNAPKILLMALNNERQCATSEKSLRYTSIEKGKDPNISEREVFLYQKWMNILKSKIKDRYGDIYSDNKIQKLAQENSRYLTSVFISTQMVHTIPWIQLNRIASFMQGNINKKNKNDFEERLTPYFKQFINCLDELDILDERAMSNRKHRELSLFNNRKVVDSFGDSYALNYKGTFSQLAQTHRHRTSKYSMKLLEEKEYFILPILKDDPVLVDEWLADISSIAYAYPQGELVLINERGTFEDFILKTKERLCTAAQLEIMLQTRKTLLKYKEALNVSNHPLKDEINKYTKGARCTFPDYECAKDCGFEEGKTLVREI